MDTKDDINVYAKADYNLNSKLNLFVDLQTRIINYQSEGTDDDLSNILIDESYTFFNPKLGVNYKLNDKSSFYASVAKASREPVRSDFVDAKGTEIPKPETLIDFELGYRLGTTNAAFNANFYMMNYQDQLVVTGAINDVGSPVRQNVSESSRMGLELTGAYQFF